MFQHLQRVFASLNAHDVRYVVIGGIAAIAHGVPRATFDLDILIDATEDNAQRLLNAFLDAGLGTASLTDAAQIRSKEITIFKDIVRVDVQTSTPGLRFADAWKQAVRIKIGDVVMPIVAREHLIASKRAAGRPTDLEDVRLLERRPPNA